MYIPEDVKKSVKMVPGGTSNKGIISDAGKTLRFNNKFYKILSLNANGITVEDESENGTVVDVLYTWDKIQ